MSELNSLIHTIQENRSPTKAALLQNFFKTGPGQYGQGDVFLGLTVPLQRKIAQQYLHLSLGALQKLIRSKIHEYRLTSLLILIEKYKQGAPSQKQKIFNLYLKNTLFINNWDLVDLSAPSVVGGYLLKHNRKILYHLAKSKLIWNRRIAIISTFTFIRHGQFEDTLKISRLLLGDSHDLIHKAVGWMLRELGKRDQRQLLNFLDIHSSRMSRTTLRYAIEKLTPRQRQYYLKK